MSAIAERRRRRTLVMFLITMLVLGAVPALGYVGVNAVLNSTGGRSADDGNLLVQRFPDTPAALYVTVDEAGVLASATVFVLAPVGVGGSIISVPVNADVGFSPQARQSLQDVYAEGGLESTVLQVESLLLVTMSYSAEADVQQAAGFLVPFEPYAVDLATEVVGTSADGTDDSIPAGVSKIDAAGAAKVLTYGAGVAAEGTRTANIAALWAALAVSVGTGNPVDQARAVATNSTVDSTVVSGSASGSAVSESAVSGSPTTATLQRPDDFEQFVERLFSAAVQTRGLSTAELEGDQNPSGVDVVEVDRAEVVYVFASIAPGSMSTPDVGPRLRIEAPAGYDVAVKETLRVLLFLKANVVSVDSTGERQADTVFYVPNDADRVRVQTADVIFDEVRFGEPLVRVEGVDATIVLGTDYLESVDV